MLYNLPMVEERVKPHQVTSLHLISALSFIITGAIVNIYVFTMKPEGLALLISGLALLTVSIGRNRWLLQSKTNFMFRIGETAIAMFIAISSALAHNKFPATIFGMLTLGLLTSIYLEQFGNKVLMIMIDESGIKLPSPARKTFIAWNEVEHAILKDNVLTINCINNNFYQWNIRKNEIEEEKFEAFCHVQVKENMEKRVVDAW